MSRNLQGSVKLAGQHNRRNRALQGWHQAGVVSKIASEVRAGHVDYYLLSVRCTSRYKELDDVGASAPRKYYY